MCAGTQLVDATRGLSIDLRTVSTAPFEVGESSGGFRDRKLPPAISAGDPDFSHPTSIGNECNVPPVSGPRRINIHTLVLGDARHGTAQLNGEHVGSSGCVSGERDLIVWTPIWIGVVASSHSDSTCCTTGSTDEVDLWPTATIRDKRDFCTAWRPFGRDVFRGVVGHLS